MENVENRCITLLYIIMIVVSVWTEMFPSWRRLTYYIICCRRALLYNILLHFVGIRYSVVLRVRPCGQWSTTVVPTDRPATILYRHNYDFLSNHRFYRIQGDSLDACVRFTRISEENVQGLEIALSYKHCC